MRRMLVNGARALVAFSTEDIPCHGRAGQAEQLARDMYWLDTGDEVPAIVDLEPPSRAVN